MQSIENVEKESKAEILKIFDEHDEDQIIAEQKGQIVQPYFYSFSENGREVTGLSYAGVRYIAGVMAEKGILLKLEFSELIETADSFRGKARVVNMATGLVFEGVAEVKKKYKSGADNPFAYVQAYNKAERNAYRKHEPERIILTQHEQWKNDREKVQKVTKSVGSGPAVEKPNGTSEKKSGEQLWPPASSKSS